MRKYYGLFCFLSLLLIMGCEKDSKTGNTEERPFIVAFSEESASYSQIEDEYEVVLAYSDIAVADGEITIRINEKNASYGVDYLTEPQSQDFVLTLPIQKGTKSTSFNFKNLIYPFDRDDKTVQFEIVKVEYPQRISIQGYSMMMVTFDASLGGVLEPEIGGATEAYQVYVELSSKNMVKVKRDSWDLAFYSQDDVVKLNGSIYMAAGNLSTTDLNGVSESDVENLKAKVAIGTFDPSNVEYIDTPSGDLSDTAIDKISVNDEDNKVYLLNLGFMVPEIEAPLGSVNVSGKSRGWKKIRVLKREEGYLLQYADLNEANFKEILIPKKGAYNFTFYSFTSESIAEVEPAKQKWDLNFTVFTNINEAGSYGYSDFIVQNRYGGVEAYRMDSEEGEKLSFYDFKKEHIKEELFAKDLRTIGSSWRELANGRKLFPNMYYIVRDAKGNYYKMRMLAFMSEEGERGHPKMEFKLLK